MSRTFDPERLKAARRARHLTAEQLATATGRAYPTVTGWESGRIRPSLEALARVADALGCPVDDLFTPADQVTP